MSDDLHGKTARILVDGMGAMSKGGGRMTDRTFPEGTIATVTIRLPEDDRFKDWWALEVDDDATIYIPAHVSMFEVVE